MDKTDIDGIATLMGNGFTLQDAMAVLQDEKSKEVFQSIQEHLQRGESLGDFFYKYLPKQHAAYFSGDVSMSCFSSDSGTYLSSEASSGSGQNGPAYFPTRT